MKDIKKLFILLITLFVFVVNVDAVFNDDACINITEKATDQWDAGFDVTMKICTYKKKPTGYKVVTAVDSSLPGGEKSSAFGSWYQGPNELKTINYWAETLDAKGYVSGTTQVPICANKIRMVQARAKCTARGHDSNPVSQGTKYWEPPIDCTIYGSDRSACEAASSSCGWAGYQCAGGHNGLNKCTNGGDPDNGCCHTNQVQVAGGKCCPKSKPDLSNGHCCPKGYTWGRDQFGGTGCHIEEEVRYMYEYNGDGESDGTNDDWKHRKDIGNGYTSGDNENKNVILKTWKSGKDRIPTNYLPAGKTYKSTDPEAYWWKCSNDVKYDLTCPYYICIAKDMQLDACVPTFTAEGGKEAYCLNPSLPYTTTSYKPIPFDITQCTDSSQSEDCGYANIMIEGKCTGASQKALYLAVRLWARYYNGAGFGVMSDPAKVKTGLANLASLIHDYKEEPGVCNKQVQYVKTPGTAHKNVYEETFKLISSLGYITRALDKNSGWENYGSISIARISCGAVGIACDAHHDTVDRAVKLVLNTIAGNKHMLQHMRDCSDNSDTDDLAIPTRAELVDNPVEDGKEKWVLIEYTSTFNEEFGDIEVIDCTKLTTANGYTQKQIDEIKPYCTTQISLVGPGGNPVNPTWCIKNRGCYYKTSQTAICVESTGTTTIKEVWIKYGKYIDGWDLRRYIPCGEQDGSGNENQIMLVFDDSGGGGKEPDITDTRWKKLSIDSYQCITGGCDDPNIRKSDNFKDSDNVVCSPKSGQSYEASVKDPSLSCIVNFPGGTNGEKYRYDYSATFGVNTDFCRIYCSDAITYTLAGKKTVYSGRPFVYDLKEDKGTFYGHSVNKDLKLSAVITEKRSCVSEIFYDSMYLPTSVDWNARYGLGGGSNQYTWKSLIDAIQKVTNENQRRDTIRDLLYNLYNCNLYANIPDDIKPNKGYINVYENIVKTFRKSNNYNIDGKEKETDSDEYSRYMDDVNYDFGSKLSTYNPGSGDNPPSETPVINPNTNKQATIGDSNNPIKNTKKYEDKNLVTVDGDSVRITYCSYSGMKTTEGADTCLGWTKPTVDNPEDYSYAKLRGGTGTEGSLSINGRSVAIPSNDYAFFEVTAEFDFFNGERFQVMNDTGSVVANKETFDELVTLEKYSYPTDKYAHNICENDTDGDGIPDCGVTQKIKVGTFRRNTGTFVDDFKKFANDAHNFTCTVNVLANDTGCSDKKDGSCGSVEFTYRNIDMSRMFPTPRLDDKGVPISKNWRTARGIATYQAIESTYDMLRTTDNLLEYRITLSPEQIRAIKEDYSGQAYVNETTYSCNPAYVEKGLYLECKSKFMDELRDNDRYGTLDPDHNTGISECNEPQSNLGCSTIYDGD